MCVAFLFEAIAESIAGSIHRCLCLSLRLCRRAFNNCLQHKLCRTWAKPALTRKFTTENPNKDAFPMERVTSARLLLRRVTRRVLKILPRQQSTHVQGRTPVATMPHAQFRAKRQPLLLLLIQRAPPCLVHPAPKKCQFAVVFQLRTELNSLAASRRRRHHQPDALNSCGGVYHVTSKAIHISHTPTIRPARAVATRAAGEGDEATASFK